MDNELLTVKEILKIVKFSRSILYLKIADGSFPKPLKLNSRRVAWLRTDIDKWIESLVEKRGR